MLFGVPVSYPDDIQQSVDAALEMNRHLAALNVAREKNGEFPLKTGIGIYTGRVLAGNIGSKTRLNYTIMGGTVNLAACLEGMTKVYGAGIVVPDDVHNNPGWATSAGNSIWFKSKARQQLFAFLKCLNLTHLRNSS